MLRQVHHLSIELLVAQNTVGINYDSRFRGIDGLGYRVGIGYCYSKNSGWFDERIKGIGMPLELNYLLGKKSSKLELGFGASLGGYHVKEKTYIIPMPNGIPISIIPMKRLRNLINTRLQAINSVISSSATSATAISDPMDSCFV